MPLSRSTNEYEITSPRGSRVGMVLLSLSAVSAIACISLLWGAQDNYLRLAAAALCGFAAWAFSKMGQRRRIPVLRNLDALQSLIERTSMPMTLYLRRFDDDERDDHPPASESSKIDSDEEGLASSFSSLCLFVAVGRPGEPLPPWGAYRLYVRDQEWQEQVKELISMASVIIVQWGTSEPLQWEIDQVRQAAKLGRTLFLLPPVDSTEELRQYLPEDPIFDIDSPDAPTGKRYAAFVTVNADGVAEIHDRDLRYSYGESARRLSRDIFSIADLTKDQQRAIRGFYGKTERLLSTMVTVFLYGVFGGLATSMLTVLLLLVPILVTEGSMQNAILDIMFVVADPLLIGGGIVAFVSLLMLGLLMLTGGLMPRG